MANRPRLLVSKAEYKKLVTSAARKAIEDGAHRVENLIDGIVYDAFTKESPDFRPEDFYDEARHYRATVLEDELHNIVGKDIAVRVTKLIRAKGYL